MLKITFKLGVFLFNPTTLELSNYFRPIQNNEEPICEDQKSNFRIKIREKFYL